MALIVQKFGGSSVKDAEHLRNVADIVTGTYKNGNDVVVVVSAQGDTTDDLIDEARGIHRNHWCWRENAPWLLTGGRAADPLPLLAADYRTIQALGYPAVPLAWPAGGLLFHLYALTAAARIKPCESGAGTIRRSRASATSPL
ncbi:hypothetical protein [Hominenteromicrobium sp.]|uniref:amino acid kinase family protein n=1 Tax=Hominenteromicrobium sp. TaxID=3073581 RepID=UPI0039997B66